jgi:hypothetical protein
MYLILDQIILVYTLTIFVCHYFSLTISSYNSYKYIKAKTIYYLFLSSGVLVVDAWRSARDLRQ